MGTVTEETFKAKGSGSSNSYDKEFWVRDPADPGTWMVAQAYGIGAMFDWSPPAAGQGGVMVWAKNLGSPATLEASKALAIEIIPP